jgi:hypothetical protein
MLSLMPQGSVSSIFEIQWPKLSLLGAILSSPNRMPLEIAVYWGSTTSPSPT